MQLLPAAVFIKMASDSIMTSLGIMTSLSIMKKQSCFEQLKKKIKRHGQKMLCATDCN